MCATNADEFTPGKDVHESRCSCFHTHRDDAFHGISSNVSRTLSSVLATRSEIDRVQGSWLELIPLGEQICDVFDSEDTTSLGEEYFWLFESFEGCHQAEHTTLSNA